MFSEGLSFFFMLGEDWLILCVPSSPTFLGMNKAPPQRRVQTFSEYIHVMTSPLCYSQEVEQTNVVSDLRHVNTLTGEHIAGNYCVLILHVGCSYADDEAAAEDDDGEFPIYLCRKWSRLKTRPQPTAGFILMKSSRFISHSEEETHHSEVIMRSHGLHQQAC